MVDHAEYPIASPFHVIIRADAPEHGRQPQITPGLMAQIPVLPDRCGAAGNGIEQERCYYKLLSVGDEFNQPSNPDPYHCIGNPQEGSTAEHSI